MVTLVRIKVTIRPLGLGLRLGLRLSLGLGLRFWSLDPTAGPLGFWERTGPIATSIRVRKAHILIHTSCFLFMLFFSSIRQ